MSSVEIDPELEAIFNEDDGLFDKIEKSKPISAADRLEAGFLEICAFYEYNNRLPSKDSEDMAEMLLGARLEGFIGDADKLEKLSKIDKFGILDLATPESSIEQVLEDDDFFGEAAAVLTKPRQAILQYKNKGDLATRKVVKDFDAKFKNIFEQIQADLENRVKKLVKFVTVTQLIVGGVYVIDGMLCLVDSIGAKKNVFGRDKERIRCIYENGTESNVYLRTLSSQLYGQSGYQVVESIDEESVSTQAPDDDTMPAGTIYILKSKSNNPEVQTIKDLHKIGYCTTSVAERLKNAKNDTTYLMAEVEVVEEYAAYNLNIKKLESLTHRFFGASRMDIKVVGRDGKEYIASEWFSAPIDAIRVALRMLIDKNIDDYEWDPINRQIELTNDNKK